MTDSDYKKAKLIHRFLFVFKAYTVVGIIFLFAWFRWIRDTSYGDYHATAFIFFGHLLASVVLIFGGLIQKIVLKTPGAGWSFIFGVVNILIFILVLPNMRGN